MSAQGMCATPMWQYGPASLEHDVSINEEQQVCPTLLLLLSHSGRLVQSPWPQSLLTIYPLLQGRLHACKLCQTHLLGLSVSPGYLKVGLSTMYTGHTSTWHLWRLYDPYESYKKHKHGSSPFGPHLAGQRRHATNPFGNESPHCIRLQARGSWVSSKALRRGSLHWPAINFPPKCHSRAGTSGIKMVLLHTAGLHSQPEMLFFRCQVEDSLQFWLTPRSFLVQGGESQLWSGLRRWQSIVTSKRFIILQFQLYAPHFTILVTSGVAYSPNSHHRPSDGCNLAEKVLAACLNGNAFGSTTRGLM